MSENPTAEQVDAFAGELYEAAAAIKQAAADATAHERQRDRNGVPIPHVLQPWSKVKSPVRELWLAKARREFPTSSGLGSE